MPATRRTSGGNRNASAGAKQSTLSFNHRVTKSSAAPANAKKNLISSPLSKQVATPPPSKPVDINIDEVEEEEEKEDLGDEDVAAAEEAEAVQIKEEPQKSEAELRAEKVTDRQIDQYWRGLEAQRVARRVHQEDLELAEKVLRYWDVSSQYGPCVGLSRKKRWQRADRLGLNPPVEVLAVLLKEESKGSKAASGFETAHMDEILNSTAVGS